jgi:hypothetical protein
MTTPNARVEFKDCFRRLGAKEETPIKKAKTAAKRRLPALSVALIVRPKKLAPSTWECCLGPSVGYQLGVSTEDYYGAQMTAEMRTELENLKIAMHWNNNTSCPSTDIAGPHAGTHCGLRLLVHLRREQKQLLDAHPVQPLSPVGVGH